MISTSRRSELPAFKVCICGQQGVGKTAILNRRTSGVFNSDYRPTIAAAFASVNETVNGRPIVLNVWDTAGQEKYQNMMPLYFRNVACVVLVLDASAPPSWEFVKRYIDTELQGINPRPLVVVAANKTDVQAAIDGEALEEWAKGLGFPIFFTSAYNGTQIKELFQGIAERLVGAQSERSKPDGQQLQGSREQDGPCC
jgi:small GTP-binding protein